jgi:hypothetical protein
MSWLQRRPEYEVLDGEIVTIRLELREHGPIPGWCVVDDKTGLVVSIKRQPLGGLRWADADEAASRLARAEGFVYERQSPGGLILPPGGLLDA